MKAQKPDKGGKRLKHFVSADRVAESSLNSSATPCRSLDALGGDPTVQKEIVDNASDDDVMPNLVPVSSDDDDEVASLI